MKTFFIDIDESLPDLVSKIMETSQEQILLIVPKGSGLFQNPISLKVLKSKADQHKKDLQIFTNDEVGQKLVQKCGLKLYQGSLRKRKPVNISQLPNEAPGKSSKDKVSITEVSQDTRKRLQAMPLSQPKKREQQQRSQEFARSFLQKTLKKKAVLGFTILAVLVFWVVFSIAVPTASIVITPASNVLDTTVNVIFANPETQAALFRTPERHIVAVTPLSTEFEETLIISATGKVFTGTRSQCRLKVTNQRTTPWTLVAKTRFTDRSGIIFRSSDEVTVPAGKLTVKTDARGNAVQEKIPGSILISVISDEQDTDGNIVGARGNLPVGTIFHLPGLSTVNQSLIIASSEATCLGGVTSYYSIITDEDIQAAQKKMQEQLKKSALKYLNDILSAENIRRIKEPEHGTSQLVLFDQKAAISYQILGIRIPPDLKNKKTDEFSISGSMRVSGLAYQKSDFDEILEQGLLEKVHPEKILSHYDTDSSTSTIVYSDSDLKNFSKIKLSVTVRGVEQYNLDPESPKGKELFAKILEFVPGKSPTEVNYFLTNLEEIQKAHISIWPFWKQDIPERAGSIKIVID